MLSSLKTIGSIIVKSGYAVKGGSGAVIDGFGGSINNAVDGSPIAFLRDNDRKTVEQAAYDKTARGYVVAADATQDYVVDPLKAMVEVFSFDTTAVPKTTPKSNGGLGSFNSRP